MKSPLFVIRYATVLEFFFSIVLVKMDHI